jgi:LCP family protein required for cell wall assembly
VTAPTAGGRRPSPLLAALASAVLPGTGQWYAGARRRGIAVLAVTVTVALPAVVTGAALAIDGGPSIVVRLTEPFFTTPRLILVLLTAQVVVAAFHIWAIIDAWRTARPTGTSGAAGMLGAASAALILASGMLIPHIWVAERALALHDLLTFDFSVDRAAQPPATTQPPAGTAPPTTTTAAPSTTNGSVTTTTSAPTTSSVPTTTTTRPAPTTTTLPSPTTTTQPTPGWYTVALLGGDSGPGRWGVRTDTIIVVALDAGTGRAALFSVPRNWQDAPFPAGHPAADPDCGCYPDIINSLYQFGLDHAELFPGSPNPGAAALLAALEELLGIGIDDYALVDLLGFERAVDALGGIEINVRVPVNDPGHVHPDGSVSDIEIRSGEQRMDGRLALAYARARQETDDYHRMDRQRCVLEAIADRADPVTILRRLPDLVEVLTDSLVTDIPVAEWPGLVSLLERIDTRATVSVRFVPGAPELSGTGLSYVNNVELVRATVRTALDLPLDEAMATIGVGSLDEVCG